MCQQTKHIVPLHAAQLAASRRNSALARSLLISASLASRHSRSDTLVAPSASIISNRCPREHNMPDLTAGMEVEQRHGKRGHPAASLCLQPSAPNSAVMRPIDAACAQVAMPTCVALSAVLGQAQHPHSIEAMLARKVGGHLHGAIPAAVVHDDDFICEVGALPVTPPLQVAAAEWAHALAVRGALPNVHWIGRKHPT